jgi:SAM-dependent methyltransferase
MIAARCSICDSDDSVIFSNRDAYFEPVRNVVCKKCGLVYLNPVMSEDETRAYYAQYRLKTIGQVKPDENFVDLSYRLGRMRLRHVKEYLGPGRKILDVGCGHAHILDLAREIGCDCVGVEPDPGFSEYARQEYGLRVYTSLFEDVELKDEHGTFDIVTFQHTFEHFRNPINTLKKVRALLKDDGVVNMDIPNLDTPRGGFVWQDLYVEHTQTYSPRTLRLLLKKTGFEIVKLDTDGYVTTEGYHVPLMNVTAVKCQAPKDINYNEEGDDYKRILWKTRIYRIKHQLLGGGWRFYLVNLPLKKERVRVQGRENEGELWVSPASRFIPGTFRSNASRLFRKVFKPYRFVDFTLPPAKDYSIK